MQQCHLFIKDGVTTMDKIKSSSLQIKKIIISNCKCGYRQYGKLMLYLSDLCIVLLLTVQAVGVKWLKVIEQT